MKPAMRGPRGLRLASLLVGVALTAVVLRADAAADDEILTAMGGAGVLHTVTRSAPSTLLTAPPASVGGTEESLLVTALADARAQRLGDALARMRALTRRHPNFRLAQLVYADLLSARARPITRFGDAPAAAPRRIESLLDEARQRLQRHLAPPAPHAVPASILALSPSQGLVLVVDIAASRLYVFRNDHGVPRRLQDYYVSTGRNGASKVREGDQRTPVGVYFTLGRIASSKLPDFYGQGALPVNYPNEWDVRLGRTGYGIWIHGVPPDTYSRPPRASDGCMALSNDDLKTLWHEVDRTEEPVVITDGIHWESPAVVARRRSEVLARIARWRRDWESRDFGRYIRHYSRSFRGDDMSYAQWVAHKRRVNAQKAWVKIRLEDLSVFAYPGEHDVLLVTFTQLYRSNNFASRDSKRQYWRREADGHWRIVYEGSPRLQRIHYRGMPYSARANLTQAGQ